MIGFPNKLKFNYFQYYYWYYHQWYKFRPWSYPGFCTHQSLFSLTFTGCQVIVRCHAYLYHCRTRKGPGKGSLHVYKEEKTCHPRNREISAIAKLHYTKTLIFSYSLMGLQNTQLSKWLGWLTTEMIIIKKKDPTQSHHSSFLKHSGVCLQRWEISQSSFTTDGKVSRIFQKPVFPIKHVHSCCCSQGIQKCQIVDTFKITVKL